MKSLDEPSRLILWPTPSLKSLTRGFGTLGHNSFPLPRKGNTVGIFQAQRSSSLMRPLTSSNWKNSKGEDTFKKWCFSS